ncbi:MAG: SGNH/GDSL hydrolase family protein [Clostridia bacterium]|nr:SGNH/GDSL hydrolase family protein [Clostridia bacterium]
MKRLVCIGDSITKGTFTASGEIAPLSLASPNYSEILKEKLKADELINYGTNGISYSSLSSVLPEQALTKTVSHMDSGEIVLLAAGTNDYGTNVELGSENDDTDISFYGAADVVFGKIKERNPSAEIFVLLPIPRQTEEKNEMGYTLDDYRQALTVKAEKFGLKCIDGRKLPIDPTDGEDRNKYMADGVHPNKAGHRMLAEFICSEIKRIRG